MKVINKWKKNSLINFYSIIIYKKKILNSFMTFAHLKTTKMTNC